MSVDFRFTSTDDMFAALLNATSQRRQHADTLVTSHPSVLSFALLHSRTSSATTRPLRCSLTISPIAHIFADLFTQAALWLPLACCTSFLGPHNAFACSARQSLRFLSLLASTASRCSLLVDEHRPLTTKRTLSNLRFDSFFSILILQVTVELLLHFVRTRRRRNIQRFLKKLSEPPRSVLQTVSFRNLSARSISRFLSRARARDTFARTRFRSFHGRFCETSLNSSRFTFFATTLSVSASHASLLPAAQTC